MDIHYSPVSEDGSSICFIKSTVPEFLRESVLKSIEEASESANHTLVGAIEDEKMLTSLDKVSDWHEYILLLCKMYDKHYSHYAENINYLLSNPEDIQLKVDVPWVNKMKKYEYNPVHMHSGAFSYVCWINIPYDMEEEKKVFPNQRGQCKNGAFSFISENTQYDLIMSKNMEWEIVLFPATQHHCVYPFFTSDEERISIAGNVSLKINKPEMMML